LSKLEQEIQSRTERFAAELAELIKKAALESVSQALAGGDMVVSGRGGRRGSAPRVLKGSKKRGKAGAGRKKGEKRTPDELEALTKALHSEVKKQPGRGIEAIAEAMGVGTKELALPVRKLLADGKLKTKGQKRATKYSAK
jgi:hypothetical protein